MRLQLRIDAAANSLGGSAALFPEDGEFTRAAAALAEGIRAGRIAREVVFHLYASELVEAVRGRVAEAGPEAAIQCVAPFWPPALFRAAGLETHAALDLLAQLPPGIEIESLEPATEAVRRSADSVFALPLFEPEAYVSALAMTAPASRPPLMLHDASGREPERHTSAGILVRDGRVLLERRPDDAQVSPGVWDIPGGHRKPGEEGEATLRRELNEELGVEALAVRLVAELDELESATGLPYRHQVYLVQVWDGEPLPREAQQLAWFTVEEALALGDLYGTTAQALAHCFGAAR